jgi:hypothetical protein
MTVFGGGMKKTILFALFFVVTFSWVSGNAKAEYTLSLAVPFYGQDTGFYCGAASGQMMMMGYPSAGASRCFSQDNVYNTIQSFKQDNGFYTDPDGLRDAVMNLNPPASPGQYSIIHDSVRENVMHSILYWMVVRNYPTATLINRGDHWVVVTGFQTDVDPRTGSAMLQSIDVNDPAPPDVAPHDNPCTAADEGNEGGTFRNVTGTSWFSNDWNNPNRWGTKWLNEYVAIVEPPDVKGRVTAKREAEDGKPISSERALTLAQRHVRERKLPAKKHFGFLRETSPTKALLVNGKFKGYYIVPFEHKDGRCPGAVVLNAYTGDFQEIAAFPRPLRYLTDREAVRIALCSIGKKPTQTPSAELVFRSSEQVRSRYRPIWKVVVPIGKTKIERYVSQLGEVFIELTPQSLGGD